MLNAILLAKAQQLSPVQIKETMLGSMLQYPPRVAQAARAQFQAYQGCGSSKQEDNVGRRGALRQGDCVSLK